MKRLNKTKVGNIVAFVVMVIINALANMGVIGKLNTGEVSAKYPNLFTPSGITFSIWAIIYSLIAIAIAMNLIRNDDASNNMFKRIGPWFIISCVLNSLWIFMWQFDEILLSTIIIVMLLLSVFNMLKKINNNSIFYWGIGLYAGWLLIATIANLFVLIQSFGFNLLSTTAIVTTFIVIILSSILSGYITYKLNIIPIGVVGLWAILGIFIKHISVFNSSYTPIIIATVIAIIIEVCFVINTTKTHLR